MRTEPGVSVCCYLVVKEGQSFDLKHEEVIAAGAGDVLRLRRLDRCRQDGPLELQDAVAHIHFAQVAKVVSALISVRGERSFRNQHCNFKRQFVTLLIHAPFSSICHQSYVQGSSWEVVAVCAGLTIEACAEAICCWCPVQDPDVLGQNSVQHLHIWELRAGCFILGVHINILRECDAKSSAKLCGAQVDGYDLWEKDKLTQKKK